MKLRSVTRSHVLVLPLIVLVVVLLEEVAEYELRKHVDDVYVRTAIRMLLYAAGFTFAANRISPWLKTLLLKLRSGSRRRWGKTGIWLFFAACYGGLFLLYLMLEQEGASALLPTTWR